MREPRFATLVALVLAVVACGRSKPAGGGSAASPPPLPQDVQKVAAVASPPAEPGAGEAEPRLSLSGEFVSPVHSRLVARTPGRVGKVLVDEGESVHQGQPLLELETDYLKIDLQRAEAELARAQAAAADAARDFERKRDLLAKGSVSPAVHDRSRAAAEQAEAVRRSAEAGLALARQRLSDSVLVSPIGGVVAERHADVGERLSEGTVAFVLQQVAPLRLRFRVPERYVGAVRSGQPVKASVEPYPGESFAGHISLVGQSIEVATRTFMVEAEFPNRDGRLRPGLFARVEADLAPSAGRSPAGK